MTRIGRCREDAVEARGHDMLQNKCYGCTWRLYMMLWSAASVYSHVRMCSDSSWLVLLISRGMIWMCPSRGKKMSHEHAIGHVWVIGYYPTHWPDVISGAQRPRGGMLMENKRSIRFGLSQRLSSVFLSVGSLLPVITLICLTGWCYVCTRAFGHRKPHMHINVF